MEAHRNFAALLLVVGLAFFVPVILSRFRKLRLPIVVGEILAGILIGRSGFNLVQPNDEVLNLFAQFGFVFLFFLAGTEIDFSLLSLRTGKASGQKLSENPTLLSIISYASTLVLAFLVSLLLMQQGFSSTPWILTVILAPSALGVIFPVLKENHFTGSRLGQALMVATMFADFGTIILLTIVVAILSFGLTFEILLVGLLFIAFLLFYRFSSILYRLKAVRVLLEDLSHATAQIKIRAAFSILLLFMVLSQVFDVEIVLGAFLAGAILSLLSTPKDISIKHQLEGFGYGFFIPIFFIMIGVQFESSSLFESPQALWLVPLMLGSALLVKLIPALIFRINFSWRETIASGFLLSARLSLIIAAATIGVQLGFISPALNAAIVLTAMILATLSPILFILIAPRPTAPADRPIVLAGANPLAVQIARQLSNHHSQIAIIDYNEERLKGIQAPQAKTILAEPRFDNPEVKTLLTEAQTLISTYNDADTSLQVCEIARFTYNIPLVIAQVNQPSELSRFEQIGVKTINPAVDRAALIVILARYPDLYEMMTRAQDNEICEAVVHNEDAIGEPLRNLGMPRGLLILAIRRNEELMVPNSDTRLQWDDRLTLIGAAEDVETARHFFGQWNCD